jgi:HPt (histidine-containing phosphotransfer) domain-containing protein
MALQQWVKPRRPKRNARASVERPSPDATASKILARLREIAGDEDDAFINDLMQTFIDEATTIIDSLQKAVAATDSAHVKKLAHRLKGMSSNVGSTAIANICRQMEGVAANLASQEAARLMALLEAEFVHVKDAMETLRNDREKEMDGVTSLVC